MKLHIFYSYSRAVVTFAIRDFRDILAFLVLEAAKRKFGRIQKKSPRNSKSESLAKQQDRQTSLGMLSPQSETKCMLSFSSKGNRSVFKVSFRANRDFLQLFEQQLHFTHLSQEEPLKNCCEVSRWYKMVAS